MRLKQSGITLIELVVFITIIGLVTTGVLITLQAILTNSSNPLNTSISYQLARARMEIILKERESNFNFTDPCQTTPTLAICQQIALLATTQGINLSSQIINESSNYKRIDVNATGTINIKYSTRVSNYENP